MAARKSIDWLAVEGAFRAGTESIASIGRRLGVSEGSVRAAARKYGWVRDPEGVKSQRVKAALAGSDGDVTSTDTGATLDAETERDVRVMRCASEFYEGVVMNSQSSYALATNPRDQKIVIESTTVATTMYRKIRGLEERVVGRTVEDLLAEL